MPNIADVRLSGYVDLAAKDEIHTALSVLLDAPVAVVDLRDVEYIDSSGLTELLLLRNQREAVGRMPVRLVSQNPVVARILDLSGLNGVFPVYADLESAHRGEARPGA